MSGVPIGLIEAWLRESGDLRSDPQAIGAPMFDVIDSAKVDSRLATPGSLFVALPGERTDGHDHVDNAVGRGAVAALVGEDHVQRVRESVFGSVLLLPVSDTLAALQTIARRWRERHPNLTRIAVTGSNGKTTTKELVAAILSRVGPTVYSHGNYNSDIGMPVELLRIREHHRFGVYEAGMNRPGEIAELAALLEPDIAVVTNVGSAHVGMVGSRRQVALEKKAVFSRFTGSQTAIVPATGEFSRLLAAGVNGTVVRHTMREARILGVESKSLAGMVLRLPEGPVRLHLAGDHMLMNAVVAITVARALDVPFEAIRAGIESVRPVFGRTEVVSGRTTVVQDCYNANPESMASALELIAETRGEASRVAILGSMKELGDEAPRFHAELLRRAMAADLDEVWLVGHEYAGLVSNDEQHVRWFHEDDWQTLERAAATIRDGSIVLLKGSRLLELERLTPVILAGAKTGGRVVHG